MPWMSLGQALVQAIEQAARAYHIRTFVTEVSEEGEVTIELLNPEGDVWKFAPANWRELVADGRATHSTRFDQ